MIRFEWDEKKNRSNRKKHGVWFEEAQQVFDDTRALIYFDAEHSDDEERFILLGASAHGRLLVVVHCECDENQVIRIISARKAKPREKKNYEKGI
jgi:uncharacterized DUF497 family protein